ncbi:MULTISPECIES: DMT family transporter [Paenibacillus]|uniref:Multidrug efflux SMR transporter n=1 Tax=Paenibacillus tianjinensis TaxID=2810347 RepID=A0ABX7LIL1_9BACL|nr:MULTISPECIES: multidrug efflux SMR transporter [Paenibacillus]QSF46330.1 multidrug efflux SMR transporter [Paenibacillus tianjinensis]
MSKSSKAWLQIAGAACFEVAWVIGLKHASAPWEWGITVLAILISFYVLISASRTLPAGTVYAVFVGLGTTGTVLADMLWFGEPFRMLKVVLIILLLAGVIGLKLTTSDGPKEQIKEVS